MDNQSIILHGFEPDLTKGYPVVPIIPNDFNSDYEKLANPTYTLVGDLVEVRYDVEGNPEVYPRLVESRLSNFAKEKDIDVQEIGMLLNCSNPVWVQEAYHFMQLYTQTWEAFYNSTATDWLEIEASLPQLTW